MCLYKNCANLTRISTYASRLQLICCDHRNNADDQSLSSSPESASSTSSANGINQAVPPQGSDAEDSATSGDEDIGVIVQSLAAQLLGDMASLTAKQQVCEHFFPPMG